MARILLGWELGAGSGHAVKLGAIGRILAGQGHEIVYAVQQIGAFQGAAVWQAPLWPAQLTTLARPAGVTPATMGDILVALGLDMPGAFAAMIGAWDRILAAVKPDAIAAEFAPALSTAAAGRVPVLAIGSGFTLPPGSMAVFPSLTGQPAVHDEAALLERANAGLQRQGHRPLPALPALFAAERQLAAAFTELDPYAAWRAEPAGLPSIVGDVPLADPPGEELFVYMNGSQTRPGAFWQGLARSGLRVRVHDPRLDANDRAILRNAGFAVEEAPVPFAAIAARSRLVLSHCGLGFTASALLAGLPHILVPFDVEKQLIAAAVTGLGLGLTMPFAAMEAEPFAEFLRAAHADTVLSTRARARAPDFRARMVGDSDEQAAMLVAALAAG